MKIEITEIDDSFKPPVYGNEVYNAPQPSPSAKVDVSLTSSSPSGAGVSGGPFVDASAIPQLERDHTVLWQAIDALRKLGLIK